jgi:O-antigen ligase
MIRDHVWWGVGLGAYGIAYTRYDRSAGLARVEQAHNEYLQLVAELGVWGIGVMVGVALALRRTLRRALGPMPTKALASPAVRGERALALGVTVALIGIGIHSAFDFNLRVTSNALLCLFLLALLENLGAQATEHPLLEEKGV